MEVIKNSKKLTRGKEKKISISETNDFSTTTIFIPEIINDCCS